MSEKVSPRAPSYVPVLIGSRQPGLSLLSTLFAEVQADRAPGEAANRIDFRSDDPSEDALLVDEDRRPEPFGPDLSDTA
jgi:hypothetical protein